MAETIINRGQLDDKNWNRENLIAGNNITITQVPQPVIDENTIGLWHFDNNDNNAIEDSSLGINSNITLTQFSYPTDIKKFGVSSIKIRPTSTSSSAGWSNFIKDLPSTDLTVDLWVRTLEAGTTNYWYLILQGSSAIGTTSFYIYSSKIVLLSTDVSIDFEPETWVHLAIEVMGTKLYYYINGVKVYEGTRTGTATRLSFGYQTAYLNTWIDELRISNVARYQGQNFTPFELPYSNDGSPQYKINATGGSGSSTSTVWFKNNEGTTLDTQLSNIVEVYKNGLLLEPSEDGSDGEVNDYSVSGSVITFTTALTIDDKVTVKYQA